MKTGVAFEVICSLELALLLGANSYGPYAGRNSLNFDIHDGVGYLWGFFIEPPPLLTPQ